VSQEVGGTRRREGRRLVDEIIGGELSREDAKGEDASMRSLGKKHQDFASSRLRVSQNSDMFTKYIKYQVASIRGSNVTMYDWFI